MNIYDTKNVIYLITNKVNGKLYYGLTSDTAHNRFIKHISDSKHANKGIDAAIRKYGKDNFTLEVIEHVDDYEELNLREEYYVAKYDTMNPKIGYNLTKGGGGTKGWHHTEESAYKCGSSFRGKKRVKAPGQVDRWRASFTGHKDSDETKAKKSKSLTLAYAEGRRTPNGKGVGGRGPMTPEEKTLNSESQKGKREMHNDELRINMIVYKDEIDTLLNNGWEFKYNKEYNKLSRKDARNLGIISK